MVGKLKLTGLVFSIFIFNPGLVFSQTKYSLDLGAEERKKVINELFKYKMFEDEKRAEYAKLSEVEMKILFCEMNKGSEEEVNAFLMATTDPEHEVRLIALNGLFRIFKSNRFLERVNYKGSLIDLRKNEKVKKVLLKAIKDDVLLIRRVSISIANEIYSPSGEFNEIFKEMLGKEKSKIARIQLMSTLLKNGFNSQVDIDELQGYLFDSDSDVVYESMRVLLKQKSPRTLENLITVLEISEDPTIVFNVSANMTVYGKKLLPYLPRVERRLVEVEEKIEAETTANYKTQKLKKVLLRFIKILKEIKAGDG